eukprot:7312227-Prorocentrum_lima.AAC.1
MRRADIDLPWGSCSDKLISQRTSILSSSTVLRYCKRVKTGMYFKRLVAPVRVVVVADVAYRSND